MRRTKTIHQSVYFFTGAVFLTCLLVFSLLRLLFLLTNRELTEDIPGQVIFYALFNRGFLYDANISSYVVFVPFLLLGLGEFFNRVRPLVYTLAKYYLFLVVGSIMAIYATDFPFFDYYNARLTKAVFSWTDHPMLMIKALFSYRAYLIYFGLFVLSSFAFLYWIGFLFRRIMRDGVPEVSTKPLKKAGLLIGLFLLIVGMRGEFRLHYRPLLPEHALFSSYAFANQLGINPVYSFAESYSHNNINYFNDKEAIENTCNYLGIKPAYNSPVAKKVSFNDTIVKRNVVIILLESMSVDIMGLYGHPDKLTPYLDSLAMENITFSDVYTDGIHTYNGVFSTLYGLPSILDFKPTKTPQTVANEYSGISNILQAHGYKSLYFCNGDKNFDNLDFFLRQNGFDDIISSDNYPREAIHNSWGVTDRAMFGECINRLNDMHEDQQPFLSVLMTISAHIGYVPPSGNYRSDDPQKQSYEFADLSLRYFFSEAAKQDWYKNTVFLLIADHGQNFDMTYDLSLSYFHTPLIIIAPFLDEKKQYEAIGLQLDVVPTIMGILEIPYVNNTLGIDLRRDSRPFAFFSSDDKIGCLNDRFFLVIRKHGMESLYHYRNKDLNNYLDQYPQLADSMRAYVYSMYQTTQYLIHSKKTGLPE